MCVVGSVRVTGIAGKRSENRLKRFRHGKSNNDDLIMKKVCEIRRESNRGIGDRAKKKWIKVVAEDTRAYNVDDNSVRGVGMCRGERRE